MKDKVIYLAIPYTWNAEESFRIANEVTAELMMEGYTVFSPVSHSHVIANHLPEKLRYDQDFWMKQDLPILRKCDELCVVVIGENDRDLIRESTGCQSEIKEAIKVNIPIKYKMYKI